MTTRTDVDTAAPGPPLPAEPPTPRGHAELGYLFAAVGAILFSTKGIAIKLAYLEGLDAEITIALRMAFALPIYVAIAAFAVADRRRRGDQLPTRPQILRAAGIGAIGYWFASYTDFLGLEYITAQFERLILFTYPLFVVLLGAAFFGIPFRARSLVAISVSYAGLMLIFTERMETVGTDVAIGSGLVVAAALAFALYQLLAKGLIGEIGPRLFTCFAMGGASLGSFVTFAVTHPLSDLAIGPAAMAIMVYIAIGATVLPTFFLSAALHRISAQANAIIGTLSPIGTIALAMFILGETLSPTAMAGAALVLAGVGWFTLADRRRAGDT